MHNGITIWKVDDLVECAQNNSTWHAKLNRYVPARPHGWWDLRSKIKAAWLVWTGKADVVIWEGQ